MLAWIGMVLVGIERADLRATEEVEWLGSVTGWG